MRSLVRIVVLTATLGFIGVVGIAAAWKPAAPATTTVCSAAHGESLMPTAALAPGHSDLSGQSRLGKGSFYARWFSHRKMADGKRMDLQGSNAASRTLPLGTTAKVINLATGKSAVVSIEDRGPYVKGRIIDLSPGTARKIGLTRHAGIAKVAVAPIAVPLPDGTVKPGVGAPHETLCKAIAES
ncbi:MAG TPA: septal ring lytic transglycosylase RlpA family protein [Steroidobacteraceae bacterium]|nr:septal ring lytic transglycosylase RlpA family protein [Steroidobacteraceae bacterium]